MTSCEKPFQSQDQMKGCGMTTLDRVNSTTFPGLCPGQQLSHVWLNMTSGINRSFCVTDCKNQPPEETFWLLVTGTGQRKIPTLRGSWDHVISQCVHDCCILQNLLGCRCFFGLNKKGCGSGFLAGTHLQHAVRLSDSHDVVVVLVVLVFLNQVFFVSPDFSATKTESCILVLWLFCC